MEHNKLSLDYDRNLINSLLDDINTKYTILYLYIIRKNLFNDLDENTIDRYERVIILDDIYKDNVENVWDKDFINNVIDLGLFKNIYSRKDYENKDGVFIIQMGEETITIEDNTILTPKDTLFRMISKNFPSINYKDFELALLRLKKVKCEHTGTIHRLIFEIGESDYVLSNEFYELLDGIGNIYNAIKIEPVNEGLLLRCNEIWDEYLYIYEIFRPVLNNQDFFDKFIVFLEKNHYIKRETKKEISQLKSFSIKLESTNKNVIVLILSQEEFKILVNDKGLTENLLKRLIEIKSNYSKIDRYHKILKKMREKEKEHLTSDDKEVECPNCKIQLEEININIFKCPKCNKIVKGYKKKSQFPLKKNYLDFLKSFSNIFEQIPQNLIDIRKETIGAKKAIKNLEKRMIITNNNNIDQIIPKSIANESFSSSFPIFSKEESIKDIIYKSKEISKRLNTFIKAFNPVFNNERIYRNIVKLLDTVEMIHNKDEKYEISEILVDFASLKKDIKVKLLENHFKQLKNNKNELKTTIKKLTEYQSENESKKDLLNENLNKLISLSNFIGSLEKRIIIINVK